MCRRSAGGGGPDGAGRGGRQNRDVSPFDEGGRTGGECSRPVRELRNTSGRVCAHLLLMLVSVLLLLVLLLFRQQTPPELLSSPPPAPLTARVCAAQVGGGAAPRLRPPWRPACELVGREAAGCSSSADRGGRVPPICKWWRARRRWARRPAERRCSALGDAGKSCYRTVTLIPVLVGK